MAKQRRIILSYKELKGVVVPYDLLTGLKHVQITEIHPLGQMKDHKLVCRSSIAAELQIIRERLASKEAMKKDRDMELKTARAALRAKMKKMKELY